MSIFFTSFYILILFIIGFFLIIVYNNIWKSGVNMGLTLDVVERISDIKNEPLWMREFRKRS